MARSLKQTVGSKIGFLRSRAKSLMTREVWSTQLEAIPRARRRWALVMWAMAQVRDRFQNQFNGSNPIPPTPRSNHSTPVQTRPSPTSTARITTRKTTTKTVPSVPVKVERKTTVWTNLKTNLITNSQTVGNQTVRTLVRWTTKMCLQIKLSVLKKRNRKPMHPVQKQQAM